MPDLPPLNPCLDCRPESSVLATLTAISLGADGAAPASQSRIVVAGNNVSVLPSATYQTVFIKNTGSAVAWIRLGNTAATGTNGEIPLAAESALGAGDGGSISVETYNGAVTAACATSTSLSVTWST